MTDRLLIAQRALIGIGVALLLIWGAAHVHRHVGQQEDMAAFQAAREAVARERILLAQSDAAVAAPQAASVLASLTNPHRTWTFRLRRCRIARITRSGPRNAWKTTRRASPPASTRRRRCCGYPPSISKCWCSTASTS